MEEGILIVLVSIIIFDLATYRSAIVILVADANVVRDIAIIDIRDW